MRVRWALVVLLVAASAWAARDAGEDDVAAVRRALLAAVDAQHDGDLAAVRACTLGDESDYQVVAAQLSARDALRELHVVVNRELRPARPLEGTEPARKLAIERIESASVSVSGDEASVSIEGAEVIRCRREGGVWKPDLATARPRPGEGQERFLRAMAAVHRSLADDVRARRIATMEQFVRETARRMLAIEPQSPEARE